MHVKPRFIVTVSLLINVCLPAVAQQNGAPASATQPNGPPPTATEPPPPTSAEQKKVLSDAAEFVINHEMNLPNFICTQVTRRFEDFTGKSGWRPLDIIVERLTYFEHRENYQVVEVNGKPANVPHNQINGASSSGEFGSVMKGIFAPDTETQFNWQGWFKLRGREMLVYSYSVQANKSNYHIVVGDRSKDLTVAYHGLIFLDTTKHYVHRITLHADGIPTSFPVQDVSLALDYEYTLIGNASYLLPLTFELRSREGNTFIKNDVDYEDYRKFGADATITFGQAGGATNTGKEQAPVK